MKLTATPVPYREALLLVLLQKPAFLYRESLYKNAQLCVRVHTNIHACAHVYMDVYMPAYQDCHSRAIPVNFCNFVETSAKISIKVSQVKCMQY